MARRRARPHNRAGAAMRLRHGRHCAYCGVKMVKAFEEHPGHKHPHSATRDHVFPKAYGGRKQVLACHGCNQLKGDMYPSEWMAFVIEHMPGRAEAVRQVFRAFGINWSEPRLDEASPASA